MPPEDKSRIYHHHYFIPVVNFFMAMVIIGGFLIYDFNFYIYTQKQDLLEVAPHHAEQINIQISNVTDSAQQLINSLANSAPLKRYVEQGDLQELREMGRVVINAETTLMQFRYIDAKGDEKVRFDRQAMNADPFEVTGSDLQNKAHQDYVKENINQPPTVRFSKLDLNIERGKVEHPFKPTFRLVRPIWSEGRFKGLIVLNYFARDLLKSIITSEHHYLQLVDQEGYILASHDPSDNWSRYQTWPFAIDAHYLKQLSTQSFRDDESAIVPLTLPFENHVWALLKPNTKFLHKKALREREHMMDIALGVMLLSLLINILIYLPLKRLNLSLFDSSQRLKEQADLLKKQEQILDMQSLIDEHVITSQTDLEGTITSVSKAFCLISGYTKEELVGQNHRIVRHPDMPASLYKGMWGTLKANRTWIGEIRNLKKDGTDYWVKAIITPVFDEAGEKVGYSAIRQDISFEKRLMEEKRYSESIGLRMELALEAGAVGIWEWDFATNSLVWDQRMYAIYGVENTKTVEPYATWHNAVDPKDIPDAEAALQHAVEHHGYYDTSFWITTPTGEKRFIKALGINEYDTRNKAIRMVGINMDITTQKLLEDQLHALVEEETGRRVQQQKLLIQQSKLAAMGEMIANIAHQWKQPLSIFSMSLIALKKNYDKGKLDAEYMEDYLTKTRGLIAKMDQTMHDFNHFFRPDKAPHTFALSHAVQESITLLTPLINRAGIDLDFSPLENATVTRYESQLTQVIINILNNGIDVITERDVSEPYLSVCIEDADQHWRIQITDNAGGIPHDVLPRIFEPYFTTKFKSDGTGIGLYMSKMIIEESFDGSLEAHNTQKGAEFVILIPKDSHESE